MSVDDKLLIDSNTMLEAISSISPSKISKLTLLRNEKEVVVQVKVGKRPKPRVQE